MQPAVTASRRRGFVDADTAALTPALRGFSFFAGIRDGLVATAEAWPLERLVFMTIVAKTGHASEFQSRSGSVFNISFNWEQLRPGEGACGVERQAGHK